MPKSKELPEELQKALKKIIDEFEKEDQTVRERQIRLWKRLDFFWNSITSIWWDEVAHDWRIIDSANEQDSGYYDKQINVFKAYLETIIAALSGTVPGIKCSPEDADNIDDVLTARGGTKIAELIYDHNDAMLQWIRALWIYCTQGMIACYTYAKEDKEFGEVEVAIYQDFPEEIPVQVCPLCGNKLPPEANMGDGTFLCPVDQVPVEPESTLEPAIISKPVGTTVKPKARQVMEINGGLFVKAPNYARTQEDCPYIAYCYETHYSNVYARYPELRKKLKDLDTKITSSSGNELYERWGRLSTQYNGEYPQNTPTVRNWWLRPSAFNCLEDDDEKDALTKRFPNGVKCVFINEQYAEAVDESLDDHWTLTYNPLANYIHFDPLGLLVTSIQEITNDLFSLTLQTIEHGIPQTFVDPSVLNFEQYRNSDTTPGAIYPAKAKTGKSLSDGFFSTSTATLSAEVDPFGNKVQEMGQFVSGALPSLFGGNQANSSRTAAQYSMSRNQALQRLQTTWKMVNIWWQNIFKKMIPAYIDNMIDDERLVKEEHNSFVNVVIKRAELNGKIGKVKVESADELPQTWGQIRDTIMQLLQGGNPEILAALFMPENLQTLQNSLGLQQFSLPNQHDREKQYEEIMLLVKSAPIPTPVGMPMPSVMPEMDVDNHAVESEICRDWLVSETGRQAKIDNPEGYENVLVHLKVHQMMMQQQMMQQMMMQGGPPPEPEQEGKDKPKLRPLKKQNNESN